MVEYPNQYVPIIAADTNFHFMVQAAIVVNVNIQ